MYYSCVCVYVWVGRGGTLKETFDFACNWACERDFCIWAYAVDELKVEERRLLPWAKRKRAAAICRATTTTTTTAMAMATVQCGALFSSLLAFLPLELSFGSNSLSLCRCSSVLCWACKACWNFKHFWHFYTGSEREREREEEGGCNLYHPSGQCPQRDTKSKRERESERERGEIPVNPGQSVWHSLTQRFTYNMLT